MDLVWGERFPASVAKCTASIDETNILLSLHTEQINVCNQEIRTLKSANTELARKVTCLETEMQNKNPLPYGELRNRLDCENNIKITALPEDNATDGSTLIKNVFQPTLPERHIFLTQRLARFN